ncbi:hypothetical protein BpHYR1_054462 [Brachionus plicatilis]|uniref:Uncharacterized protein n=1 Tax=Brachionus plicatilis TaxID=10195 RepID=A0A3M7Q9E8_BRAPC|nr:hypothetical protein BpHYR1_054462 [Brachionus plicatilis]
MKFKIQHSLEFKGIDLDSSGKSMRLNRLKYKEISSSDSYQSSRNLNTERLIQSNSFDFKKLILKLNDRKFVINSRRTEYSRNFSIINKIDYLINKNILIINIVLTSNKQHYELNDI